jgi:hypothetical protein
VEESHHSEISNTIYDEKKKRSEKIGIFEGDLS